VERKNQEVDWTDYFNSIKTVCPHSIESFEGNRVKLVPFFNLLNEPTWINYAYKFDALLFIGDNKVSLGLLKNLVDYLDNVYKDLEFFYSYPYEGKYSTPVPCLIVQNKSTLDAARKEYKEKLTE